MPPGDVRTTWLGHAAFKFDCPAGMVVYVDPWLGNPRCPESLKQVGQAAAILVTHGHFDHIGDSVDIVKKTSAKMVCNFEISVWLESQGVRSAMGMNRGGTVNLDGIRITMVSSDHSSGISGDSGIVDGGTAAGFVVQFENDYKVYHAGDTNVFGEMRPIGELYAPDVALLPIGDYYTMSPTEAAIAV